MSLKGYTIPRPTEGRSSLVPPPPWHYVGNFLVVDFWADPDAAVALLPGGLEPHDDPGRCSAVVAEWQGFSETGDELVDPSRSQYREAYVVVNAFLWKQALLIKDVGQYEAGDHDQRREHDDDQQSGQRAAGCRRCRERQTLREHVRPLRITPANDDGRHCDDGKCPRAA